MYSGTIDGIKKIWQTVGTDEDVLSVRQLGGEDAAANSGSHLCRLIPVTVASREDYDIVLDKITNLIQCQNETYKKVNIKKDVNSSVRAQWKSLCDTDRRKKTVRKMLVVTLC